MNTTLPPPRDLPPRAHARIRAELERAVSRRSRRVWLAPALTSAVAVVLVAFLAWPAGHDDGRPRPAGPDTPPVTTTPRPPGERPAPVLPGVSPAQRTEIEERCGESQYVPEVVLYQLVEDAAGENALLYSPDGQAMECIKYEAGYTSDTRDVGPLDWLPGPVSVDVNWIDPSVDDMEERFGVEVLAGRKTSAVARVTYTADGVTRNAALGNGTFMARIPITWDSGTPSRIVVRAYDAHGKLLATVDNRSYDAACYRIPGGPVLTEHSKADPATCRDAEPWR